jgi:hypothetical protein
VDELSPVSLLLKKARRRCLIDLVLDQSALAISIAMAGAILVMLTGTSLLEWYWIALIAIVSLGIGVYRLRQQIPSEYRLAQRIDWKMSLADALSTAKYFAETHSPIVDQQRDAAEQVARGIDPRIAVPFTRSRFAWPAAGLALVACGLFAVRYAVLNTMSLEPSLVKSAYDTFFGGGPQQQAKNIRKAPIDKNSPLDPGNPDAPTTQNDQIPDSQLQSVETPDVNNSKAEDQSKSAAPQGHQQPSQDDQTGDSADKGEKGDQASKGEDGNQDKTQGDKSKDGKKDGKQDAKNQNQNNPENSSMLDKLKDAMANMLNKMKSTPPKEGQQSAQNSQDSKQGGQEKGNQKSSQNQKGSQSDSQEADAQSDQQQQQGDKSEKKQSANAKSGDKSQDKNNSPDAKSGIGSSDGDKTAKEAEQQNAMGKISEILGKRSANVTGEVMVEVGSTKQQLKTPWAQKQATHVEAGSEIHRDEVPLMYQQFVQQYFEEIRKTPDAGKQAKPAPDAKADSKAAQKSPSP